MIDGDGTAMLYKSGSFHPDLPRFTAEMIPGVSPHEVAYECGTRMLAQRLMADVKSAVVSAMTQPPAEEASAPAQE